MNRENQQPRAEENLYIVVLISVLYCHSACVYSSNGTTQKQERIYGFSRFVSNEWNHHNHELEFWTWQSELIKGGRRSISPALLLQYLEDQFICILKKKKKIHLLNLHTYLRLIVSSTTLWILVLSTWEHYILESFPCLPVFLI